MKGRQGIWKFSGLASVPNYFVVELGATIAINTILSTDAEHEQEWIAGQRAKEHLTLTRHVPLSRWISTTV